MQVIDPSLEPTHYWGEVEHNQRAIDIWIGDGADRNGGHGARMMGAVIDRCFADPDVTSIIIDPLNSNRDAHRFYQRLGFKVVGRRFRERRLPGASVTGKRGGAPGQTLTFCRTNPCLKF